MKKSRYTEEQVAYAVRLAESGTPVAQCVSPDRDRRGDVLPLEEEVRQPRCARGPRAAADARRKCAPEAPGGRPDAGQADPPGGDSKKRLKPARRRELAQWIHDRYQVSCRRSCALAHICPNTWYHKSQARDASALRMRIREIAQARPRFGYVRIWIMLRREGWRDNKKRVHQLYRLEGLTPREYADQRQQVCERRPPSRYGLCDSV